MVFDDLNVQDGTITYFCEYIASKTGINDQRSKEFVLGYKNKNKDEIKRVADYLYPLLGNDFALAVIPSSKMENNYDSASHHMCGILLQYAEADGKKIYDATRCLKRKQDVESQHMTQGYRSVETHLASIVVEEAESVIGRDVLVIDDVTTTGVSFEAAESLLKQAGARSVVFFAVGKTESYRYSPERFRNGFIFDLDQTLFDTSHIAQYRKKPYWEQAYELAKKCEPDDRIRILLEKIRSDGGEICIVTNSPYEYAKIFATKLGIENIIAYNDVKKRKPYNEPYIRARMLMGVYDGCIVVVGNETNDIIPGKNLGMTTVMAEWFNSKMQKEHNRGREREDISARADYIMNCPLDMINNMDKVIKKARYIREKV